MHSVEDYGVASNFLPSEELWQAAEPLLPEEPPKPRGGRPREDPRKMFPAIFYGLRPGIQGKALPRSLGASSPVHDRVQECERAGVFEKLWTANLLEYEGCQGLGWEWQSLAGAMPKAPLGGEATGPNPTDRGKSGTKRHLRTEASGLPVGLGITGANRHAKTQVEAVLEAMPLPPKSFAVFIRASLG